MSFITFNAVAKTYKGNDEPQIKNLNLEIEENELVTITGKTGAGKTTLIRLLLGEIKPDSGEVIYNNKHVHKLKGGKLVEHRQSIGVVFQDFKLLKTKTVAENIAFAMEVAGRKDSEIKEYLPHLLQIVNMEKQAHKFPGELSGGEQQKLAIARAISNQPDLILADEPTGNLDPESSNEIINLFQKLNGLGKTVIITTHGASLASGLSKRIIKLDNGRILSDLKSV